MEIIKTAVERRAPAVVKDAGEYLRNSNQLFRTLAIGGILYFFVSALGYVFSIIVFNLRSRLLGIPAQSPWNGIFGFFTTINGLLLAAVIITPVLFIVNSPLINYYVEILKGVRKGDENPPNFGRIREQIKNGLFIQAAVFIPVFVYILLLIIMGVLIVLAPFLLFNFDTALMILFLSLIVNVLPMVIPLLISPALLLVVSRLDMGKLGWNSYPTFVRRIFSQSISILKTRSYWYAWPLVIIAIFLQMTSIVAPYATIGVALAQMPNIVTPMSTAQSLNAIVNIFLAVVWSCVAFYFATILYYTFGTIMDL